MNIEKHATNVVEGFKKSLNTQQRALLTEDNYGELHILVEAALGSTAQLALHTAAKDLENMAKMTRKKAASVNGLEE
ncbi:hypothetical protein [Thiomicrorhabdus sp. Milos-T2]|uniref:hypothetical protein n=1 Tax=Thiomicrorhabdus sp. Milos-T2 TaxID=90814 RepID=UPI000494706B|nr:hypothetical protein [Thiomicrorhabdus sp. Milos-T2]